MRIKPRGTVLNNKAQLYKRYTDIDKSLSLTTIYKTIDNKLWVFSEQDNFVEVNESDITPILVSNTTVLRYKTKIYRYIGNVWQESAISEQDNVLTAKLGNIAKYQANKYYYAGSFDYMRKGSEESSDIQPIKGNIMPLTTMTIKYWSDYIHIDHDDLLVIGGKLYSVESLEKTEKRMPKPYNIYFATINSIL